MPIPVTVTDTCKLPTQRRYNDLWIYILLLPNLCLMAVCPCLFLFICKFIKRTPLLASFVQ